VVGAGGAFMLSVGPSFALPGVLAVWQYAKHTIRIFRAGLDRFGGAWYYIYITTDKSTPSGSHGSEE
jgi:hypothetical protein